MIDLNALYEKAPQLAPKCYRAIVKKPKFLTAPSNSDLRTSSIFKNPFRANLLNNLAVHRYANSIQYETRKYACFPKKTSISIRASISSSSSPIKLQQVEPFESLKKKLQKKRLESELKSALVIENQTYQKNIPSKLKSTMPKFLQSNRKKALRSVSEKA